jgi:hypothetical protein
VAGAFRSDVSDVHGGLGNYDYLARIGVPGVFPSVAAVATTGKIAKPLITVAGTMDALLPIQRQARAYESGGQQQ